MNLYTMEIITMRNSFFSIASLCSMLFVSQLSAEQNISGNWIQQQTIKYTPYHFEHKLYGSQYAYINFAIFCPNGVVYFYWDRIIRSKENKPTLQVKAEPIIANWRLVNSKIYLDFKINPKFKKNPEIYEVIQEHLKETYGDYFEMLSTPQGTILIGLTINFKRDSGKLIYTSKVSQLNHLCK